MLHNAVLRELLPYRDHLHFVEAFAWEDPPQIAALFDGLLQRAIEDDTQAADWLAAWRELESICDQEYSIRNIEMTCDTEDPEKASALTYFTQKIQPILLEKSQALKDMALKHPLLRQRVRAEAPVFFSQMQTDARIFRQENIAIFTELENLSQDYQKLNGSMMVEWEGKQITLLALRREFENTQREVRERAYFSETTRRLQEKVAVDKLFDRMCKFRGKIAENAGFANFRDFTFPARHRDDYTPAECAEFHAAIAQYFGPLVRKLHGERKQKLQLLTLRPWDLSVDITGEKSLAPFRDTRDLVEKVHKIFLNFDSQLAGFFQEMEKHSLFDLANRKGKCPGGYQALLIDSRLPFIFMNAVGVHRDVITLLHESGHAFHSFLARDLDAFQINAPMEFCEVASMSMELLSSAFLPDIFGKRVATQLMRQTLLKIPELLLQVAMVDAFQHWVYTEGAHQGAEARHQKWFALSRQFQTELDMSGIEDRVAADWQRIPHIFASPFYYIEYGIAEIGALQFWERYLQEPEAAILDYKRALAAGGTLGLKDLFRRANLDWSLHAQTIERTAKFLEEKLTGY